MCGQNSTILEKYFLVALQSSFFLLTQYAVHTFGFSLLLTVAMRFACQQ